MRISEELNRDEKFDKFASIVFFALFMVSIASTIMYRQVYSLGYSISLLTLSLVFYNFKRIVQGEKKIVELIHNAKI